MEEQNLKFVTFGLFFCVLFFTLFVPINQVKAMGASLYLSPASGSFFKGSTFTVSVLVNSQQNSINAVWAELEFPAHKLQVAYPVTGISLVGEWLNPPRYSNEQGIVSFRGGIPDGITTSAGLIATITFRAISSGNAKISFNNNSGVFLNDGQGTDILEEARAGEYQILIPPAEGPLISSPTHPNENEWYPDNLPAFSWHKEGGVADFSWSFNQNSTDRPDGEGEGFKTTVSFEDIEDGVWYFHLRQQQDGIWGRTSHRMVKIDKTLPEEFFPSLKTNSFVFGNQMGVHFETKDLSLGIDHYEISVAGSDGSGSMPSFFTEAVSPYKVPKEQSGKYDIIIKAIDRAGNIRQEEIKFRRVFSFLTFIGGRGFAINGVFISWGLLIFLIIISMIIYWVIKMIRRKQINHKKGIL